MTVPEATKTRPTDASARPKVHTTITQYEVSVLPQDDINRSAYTITVEYRGDGKWGVCRHRQCLDFKGRWSFESLPSGRTDKWLKRHRFDLETALRLAEAAAPDLVCNGFVAKDVAARAEL